MSQVVIKGMARFTVGAGAIIVVGSNSGMFATVARPGAGDFDITVDQEFQIDPDDVVSVMVEGVTALGTSVVRTSPTAISVAFINAAAAAADPSTGFAVLVEGPLIG